jgi:hypothetical protein
MAFSVCTGFLELCEWWIDDDGVSPVWTPPSRWCGFLSGIQVSLCPVAIGYREPLVVGVRYVYSSTLRTPTPSPIASGNSSSTGNINVDYTPTSTITSVSVDLRQEESHPGINVVEYHWAWQNWKPSISRLWWGRRRIDPGCVPTRIHGSSLNRCGREASLAAMFVVVLSKQRVRLFSPSGRPWN